MKQADLKIVLLHKKVLLKKASIHFDLIQQKIQSNTFFFFTDLMELDNGKSEVFFF